MIDWISERAGTAEIARRAAEGRVVLRRLNRAEYANTVRDLLGVDVDLTDLLPPDTSTSGFDNSAEALHTSSFLMRSYLEAADRVLDEAIANEPQPWMIKKRFDIKEEKSVKATGSVYRHVDDGVAIFAPGSRPTSGSRCGTSAATCAASIASASPATAFRASKPVTFHVTAGTLKEVTEERLVDYFAVPADKPTVIEFAEQLEPENRIRIVADGLPALPPAVEKVGRGQVQGPGPGHPVGRCRRAAARLLAAAEPPAIFGDLKQARVPGATIRTASRSSRSSRWSMPSGSSATSRGGRFGGR